MSFRKRHPPVGSRPGTLAIPAGAPMPVISVIRYNAESVEEFPGIGVERLVDQVRPGWVTWIDVQGLGDEAVLRRLGDIFGLHPLALEDAVNAPQRPKTESYDSFQLFITRMGRLREEAGLECEQVCLFIGDGLLLTLQERYGDVFDPVRQRIRAGKGPMRKAGADYLGYALIDTVIDGYYPILERLGEALQDLEDELLDRPTRASLRRVQHIRRQLIDLRRAVWPQREAVNTLIREENPLVGPTVRVYLRDCQDHAVQIVDVCETYRELAASLMDMYLSAVSQRTNEVMKVLTIMASIFIPLTFLAGVYGMNFQYLPELHLHWAYPAFWGLILVIALGMLYFFRRRGWLGGEEE
jgi:magnesium transporter